MDHLRAGAQVELVQPGVAVRVRELVRAGPERVCKILRRLCEVLDVNPNRGFSSVGVDKRRFPDEYAAPSSIHARVQHLVLEQRQVTGVGDVPRVVLAVLEGDKFFHFLINFVDGFGAVEEVRRRREERSHGRVAKVVLGEPVLDVVLVGVVVPDRQPRGHLLALLVLVDGCELLVVDFPRERVDQPTSGSRKNGLVVNLNHDELIRLEPGVQQRRGLVVVMREAVEDPPANHAVVAAQSVRHERHHEIVWNRFRGIEVPLRLDAQLRRVIVRGVAQERAGIDVRDVQRLREPLRDGALAGRRGSDDGDAGGFVPVDADARVPSSAAEAPHRPRRHGGWRGVRDGLLEPRVPRAVRLVLEHAVVHALGDGVRRSVLGALDHFIRRFELGLRFEGSIAESLRRLAGVREIALVLTSVVRRVREEHEEGVETRGAHRGGARGVRLQHRHLTRHAQLLNLGERRPVHHRDRRVADVFVDPLAVPNDDLGALQELAVLSLGLERLFVHEPVVNAVDLAGFRRSRGCGQGKSKRFWKFLKQSLEHVLLPRTQRAGYDERLGRRNHELGMDSRDRALQVAVREFRGVVQGDNDVGEESVFVAAGHRSGNLVQSLGDFLLLLVGEFGWLLRERHRVLVHGFTFTFRRFFTLGGRRRRLIYLPDASLLNKTRRQSNRPNYTNKKKLTSRPSTLDGVTRQNAPRGYTSRKDLTP